MNMSEPVQFGTLRGEMRSREPMARHVSWRAGGHAERAYIPADLADLVTLIRALPREEPVYMIGLGSNLLVRDGGLEGTVVLLHGVLNAIAVEGDVIHAEAGVAAPKVARVAALNGFTGAEFLAGIPGTVGGALAMNAGCYGGETWRIVASVTTIDRAGNLHDREPVDYEISYRTVGLKAQQAVGTPTATPHSSPLTYYEEEWFVAARFKLPRGDSTESRTRIKELLARRIASQPLDQPNAGSVFRNPPNDFAARLIEACGLKGTRSGGAMISDKHSNFIVNTGGASAADIEALIEMARAAVRAKFGVELEREVKIIGEA
jgi:UDP-N-acetylmuramate dehydrogenase